jgi:hypothetical protein
VLTHTCRKGSTTARAAAAATSAAVAATGTCHAQLIHSSLPSHGGQVNGYFPNLISLEAKFLWLIYLFILFSNPVIMPAANTPPCITVTLTQITSPY